MTLSEFQPNRSTATLATIKPSFQLCACKARFYARLTYATYATQCKKNYLHKILRNSRKASNARFKTGLARETEHILIWCKQHKKWPTASLEFVMWYKIMAAVYATYSFNELRLDNLYNCWVKKFKDNRISRKTKLLEGLMRKQWWLMKLLMVVVVHLQK